MTERMACGDDGGGACGDDEEGGMQGDGGAYRDDDFYFCHPGQNYSVIPAKITLSSRPRAGISSFSSYRKIQSIYPVSPKQSGFA